MQHQPTKIEDLTDSFKQYISTNYELMKLEAAERVLVVSTGFISYLLVGLISFLCLFFTSIAAGFYFSNIMGDNFSGFAVVAGFYLLVSIILILFRKNIVETPISNKFIAKIFSKN